MHHSLKITTKSTQTPNSGPTPSLFSDFYFLLTSSNPYPLNIPSKKHTWILSSAPKNPKHTHLHPHIPLLLCNNPVTFLLGIYLYIFLRLQRGYRVVKGVGVGVIVVFLISWGGVEWGVRRECFWGVWSTEVKKQDEKSQKSLAKKIVILILRLFKAEKEWECES